jgi:hypothetical protein
MLRACSICGLGAIFLAISPKLRDQVHGVIGGAVSSMELYSPFSYIAGVILILATMVYSFHSGSRAR